MDEVKRRQRNEDRLVELYPTFGNRLARVIGHLEAAGWRPRIQDAWRSPEAQLAAFNAGNSKLRFGFHNVTGAGGRKEALAVDLLDDDNPLNSRKPYLLQLAATARAEGLETGIGWGLPDSLREAVENAIAAGQWRAAVKIGWDPTHVQPTGISPQQAENGVRPT